MKTRALSSISENSTYRYDIFKGVTDPNGIITRIRSVGYASIQEGQGTFVLTLKTFLADRFYMLPDHSPDSPNNYLILTRELSRNLKKKYYWNVVGEARILVGLHQGLMKLSWDVLAGDLYMSMEPLEVKSKSVIHEQFEKSAA